MLSCFPRSWTLSTTCRELASLGCSQTKSDRERSLKYEDVIPDTELKAKIDAWAAEGKVEQPKEVMDVDDL